MQPNSIGGANGGAGGAGGAAANGQGNSQLNQAFNQAIGQAQQTLAITTEKGADLYALKQQVR